MKTSISLLLPLVILLGCSAKGSELGGGPRRPVPGPDGILDSGPGGPMMPADSDEICGDGMDNDANGLSDEGCTCTIGEMQGCWTGAATRRGVGACRDGVQTCESYGEFASWGACVGQAMPSGEIGMNCADEDCDGAALGCSMGCAEFETCGNGIDDDCNGLVDCEDPVCSTDPACASGCTANEFACRDGRDEDCDGHVDCADPECSTAEGCASTPPPATPMCEREFPFFVEVWCGDGRDNDCDGLIDCMDPDCESPGNCGCAPRETLCSDGVDEDCDEHTDCGDSDCASCEPGSTRWCDDPVYCHWGRQNCNPDGSWGTCVEVMDRPMGCTTTLYSADCCVMAGECCQNFPIDDSSIGMCDGITRCGG
jgi:hypothetical protein